MSVPPRNFKTGPVLGPWTNGSALPVWDRGAKRVQGASVLVLVLVSVLTNETSQNNSIRPVKLWRLSSTR